MTEQPEQRLSANQRYHMVLADIAMAAAIKTFDPGYAIAGGETCAPRSVRDSWLAQCSDESLKKRVSAMASAGVNSLKALDADQLAAAAERYGVSLADGASELMAGATTATLQGSKRLSRHAFLVSHLSLAFSELVKPAEMTPREELSPFSWFRTLMVSGFNGKRL